MEEALDIIKACFPNSQIFPDREYGGKYIFNVAPEKYNPDTDGPILDGMYSVDLKTGEVKHFYPIFEKGYMEEVRNDYIRSLFEGV